MESEGADRICRRSVAAHKLRYTELYSNGDSKSYNQVKDAYSADGHSTQEIEERNSWSWWKRKTHRCNCYGIAIPSNVGDFNGMKKAIHASFFHCASSERRDLHTHCPTRPSSWCGYQRDRNSFKHGLACLMLSLQKSNLCIKD